MDADRFIETTGLSRLYACGEVEVPALRDVTLSIARGRFVGVTGASGSGKSTLMNLLGGLDTPSSGTIRVAGRLISDLGKKDLALYRRNTIGMIFQSFNLVNAYTAIENAAFPLLFAGVAKKHRLDRAAELLDSVWRAERTIGRPSFPAASSSGSQSPGRWSTGRRSCWPTNPQAISTARHLARSWRFSPS
ncbi:MAG TPA: ATP-binding cassette domain-containing protein [Sedimentisphaerales bacterium]|nr:ATP-binding cassette domain-containing protein [Sedimentisphaerales bacterium]